MMKWVAEMIHWMTQNYSYADQMFEKTIWLHTAAYCAKIEPIYIPSVALAQISLCIASRIENHLVDKINWHFCISSSILNLEITTCGLGNCELGETNYYQCWSSWCRQWDPTPKHSLSHLLALSSPTLLHIYIYLCVRHIDSSHTCTTSNVMKKHNPKCQQSQWFIVLSNFVAKKNNMQAINVELVSLHILQGIRSFQC